jgi:proline racemase
VRRREVVRFERFLPAIDTHTGGNPTRVVIGGGENIPGKTMAEKRDYFVNNLDHIRAMLVEEPRGHKDMYAAFLLPATRNDADYGVLYMSGGPKEVGYHDMCGHGSIGVATVLVETGMVTVNEPITEVNLDTPAGLILTKVAVNNGSVQNVTIRNVPSFFIEERKIMVPDIGNINLDVAFGGEFYVFISEDEMGIKLVKENISELIIKGMRVKKVAGNKVKLYSPNSSVRPVLSGVMIYGSPTNPVAHGKNLVVYGSSSFDRSPCGTGTSARMASLYEKGKLKLKEEFVHESIIGSLFRAKLVEEMEMGEHRAVIPEITGSAYITGFSNFVCSANDPHKYGFFLG